MTRVQDRRNIFVFSCLLLEISSFKVTQEDVSHEWLNDFYFKLSSSKCQNYSVVINQKEKENVPLPWNRTFTMDGNTVNLTLTQCNGRQSPQVHINLQYPELVKNVQCQTVSRKAVCTWVPIEDFKFFYVFVNESEIQDDSTFRKLSFEVKECPLYTQANGVSTGCELQLLGTQIYISFRGTKNHPSLNTFRRDLISNDCPSDLTWNVTKTAEGFLITWNYTEIRMDGNIIIKYVECGESKFQEEKRNARNAVLNRVSHCPYQLAIKAKCDIETEWSESKYFEAHRGSQAYVYAAILTPLVIAVLVAAALICFWRNKDVIFPKIPEPRNLLAGISDNTFKDTLAGLYRTSKEEICKISLVTEPVYANIKPVKHPLL